MKLNAPKQITLLISVILIVVGVIVQLTNFVPIIVTGGFGFWLTFVGGGLLTLSCVVKGL